MTELELRNKVVDVMRGWLGWSEANGKFRSIIDLYNTQRPLPRGYAVQYDDEWCATTVTAAGMARPGSTTSSWESAAAER